MDENCSPDTDDDLAERVLRIAAKAKKPRRGRADADEMVEEARKLPPDPTPEERRYWDR